MYYLCIRKRKGTLAEWLGNGLQNRVRRFESARYLSRNESLNRDSRSSFLRPTIILTKNLILVVLHHHLTKQFSNSTQMSTF